MTDEHLAKSVVRDVFMIDLKGDVGHLARRSVTLADREDIARRLEVAFAKIREEERARHATQVR